jgi:rhamnosyltransferase
MHPAATASRDGSYTRAATTAVAASVIVRAMNKADTIERSLTRLLDQTVEHELIVIDSGSTDGTVDIARRYADHLVQIPREEFSYGRALNLGARLASAPVHFAVSAHCLIERRDWIERALAHYERPEVAATAGARYLPDGRPLLEPFYQDAGTARVDPRWGFSNHASSWRASVWERFPFDEDMASCEDREWSWRVLAAGHRIVFDPRLYVGTGHRRAGGLAALYERTRREATELARKGHLGAPSLRESLREWWNDIPEGTPYPPLFHRLNYLRATEIAARHAGQRRGVRARR